MRLDERWKGYERGVEDMVVRTSAAGTEVPGCSSLD